MGLMDSVFSLVAKLTLDSSEYDEGLTGAKKQASELGATWDKAKTQISNGAKSIATGVGVIAGAGAAAFKAADSASKNLDNIDKMSQKLGLSAQAYQEWDYVLQISGADIESMSTGLKTLTNKFDSAKEGTDSAVKSFERLGLSMEDIQDLSREDLFATVIYAFQDMEDSAERAALANDLFGRSGQELAPLFNTTAEETQALIQQVNDMGGILSDDAVKSGAAFQDSLTSLKTALNGATASLVTELIPAITSLMDKITEFVASGGLDRVIETLKALAPVVGLVVAAFAGFKIVTGVISIIQGVSTAMQALNLVFAANPIGLVIAAVAALIAIFVTLWNNCEEFRNFWIGLWDGIKEAFQATVEFFSNAFKDIAEKASEAWENIKSAFSTIGSWFKEKFESAKKNATDAWSNAKEKFSTVWSEIKSAFVDPQGWFRDKFQLAKQSVVNVWSNIKSEFGNIWENIKSAFLFGDAFTWGKDMITNFVNGVKNTWETVKTGISDAAQGVKNFFGFSEPKEGPLSDFHTYAPDMMKLFAKGIEDNKGMLMDTVADAFNFQPTIDSEFGTASGRGGSAFGSNEPVTIIVQSVLDGRVIGETAYRYGQNRLRTVGG